MVPTILHAGQHSGHRGIKNRPLDSAEEGEGGVI